MERSFEAELSKIKNALLMMASMGERNVNMAMRALVERDDSLAETVESEDTQIDALEVQINNMAIEYLARQAPVAIDLRFIITVVKICSDLERVGDQAVKIARRARELNKEPLLKPCIDIPRMCQMALEMLRLSLDAFVSHKIELIAEIENRDDMVDKINRQLYRELTSYMIETPQTITRCLNLMAVSRHLERIADHANNIAKKVYFLYEGKDISHQKTVPGTS